MVESNWWVLGAGTAAVLAAWPAARLRLELSRAKHPSLAGHVRWAKRVAAWLPGYDYEADRFFAGDGAPADVAARRQAGLERLGTWFRTHCAKSMAETSRARAGLSDLQFTSRYRVPFPYSERLREYLSLGAFAESSQGVRVTDLDGNAFVDVSGSYGVNVFGVDFYRE